MPRPQPLAPRTAPGRIAARTGRRGTPTGRILRIRSSSCITIFLRSAACRSTLAITDFRCTAAPSRAPRPAAIRTHRSPRPRCAATWPSSRATRSTDAPAERATNGSRRRISAPRCNRGGSSRWATPAPSCSRSRSSVPRRRRRRRSQRRRPELHARPGHARARARQRPRLGTDTEVCRRRRRQAWRGAGHAADAAGHGPRRRSDPAGLDRRGDDGDARELQPAETGRRRTAAVALAPARRRESPRRRRPTAVLPWARRRTTRFPRSPKARRSLEAEVKSGATTQTWNAVGRLTGSDPASAKEVILLSAHLDHIGARPPAAGAPASADTIYNGADDDASGRSRCWSWRGRWRRAASEAHDRVRLLRQRGSRRVRLALLRR